MVTRELDREHREAATKYVRLGQELTREQLNAHPDQARIDCLSKKRDDALGQLDAVREKVLKAR